MCGVRVDACVNILSVFRRIHAHLSKCFRLVNMWTRSIGNEYAFLHVRNILSSEG